MCTVSFIPVRDHYFLTSNRDEKYTRQQACHPAIREYKKAKLIYPKDPVGGGSWITLKENGNVAVLLNGAFIQHLSQPVYRRSRGLILLDILSEQRPSHAFQKVSLDHIEPFTLVLFEKGCLFEFRWDGTEKYCKQLPANRPHIWSSATLYDGLVTRKREQWFTSFLNRCPNPTQLDILNFHRLTGKGNNREDLLMSRDGVYATVSITSILLTQDRGSMQYWDLLHNNTSEVKFELFETIRS